MASFEDVQFQAFVDNRCTEWLHNGQFFMRLSDKDAGKRIKEFVQASLDIAHGEGRETQADVDAVYALEAKAEAQADDDTCKTQPGSGFAHMVGAFGDHEPRVGYHRLFGNH
jgi:hypothetical protein